MSADRFQEMSASLLLLWLLARLLVLLLPIGWLVSGGARLLLRAGGGGADAPVHGPLPMAQRTPAPAAQRPGEGAAQPRTGLAREIELETARLDALVARLEAGEVHARHSRAGVGGGSGREPSTP